MPKVSIIVPVYNAKDYLHRCVDSILAQTFTDFELLLIDDGSTDSSDLICDEYAIRDSRVKVFHKENGGVSSARNLGLDNAIGEWITFVDSDDWIDQHFLSNFLIDNIYEVDLVISYARYVGGRDQMSLAKYDTRFVDGKDINTLFLENDLAWQTSPWAKLYKRDKCESLRFTEGMHIGEDLVFLYRYIMVCDTIYVSGEEYYNYDISRECSLTRSIGNIDDELFAHNNIYITLDTLIDKYNIIDTNVLNKIGWIKSYYVHRVLNSLYKSPRVSRKQRCEIIKSLDIETYIKQTKFALFKERIIQYLLHRKLYCLYDFVRVITVRIKG